MSRSSPPRVLVGSWLGSTNLGDELLFRALLRRLAAFGSEVTAISLDPEATLALHRVEAVGHRDVGGIVRAAGDADAFVFGGGDLIQDITSPWNLPYHLGRVVLARARRLPVVGVGLGLPPLCRRWSPALVRAVWPRDAPMAVRDQGSADVARRLGLDARVGADLVFGLEPPVAAPEDAVVVCLRPWHGGGRRAASSSWAAGVDARLVSALSGTLEELAVRVGLPLRFVALQPDRDGPFHEAVAARIAKAQVSCIAPDLGSVLEEVARSRLVVSARYHGAVLALLAGRPAVALTYADKVARLAADAPEAVRAVPFEASAVPAVAGAGEALLRRVPDVESVRDTLRERVKVNDEVLASVLATPH